MADMQTSAKRLMLLVQHSKPDAMAQEGVASELLKLGRSMERNVMRLLQLTGQVEDNYDSTLAAARKALLAADSMLTEAGEKRGGGGKKGGRGKKGGEGEKN